MALTKEDIQALQAALSPQLEAIQADLKQINDRMTGTETSVNRIDQSVIKLEAMPHQIQLMAENQQHISEKINRLQESIDDMAPTVTALDILHKMREHQ